MFGAKCVPCLLLLLSGSLRAWRSGQLLEVVGEGGLEFDNVQRWVKNNGHEVVEASKVDAEFRVLVRKH